ncbi:MAG: bifunctional phosphopantothenoylcysteine decarboxylase/phosphopantothenate--cysteine ligase CoaBC [Cytophagales bacterium]|nr:bifunctional phosphopantothenoylcysteine decarboxylase/phosphopantothenate--cysteine ligase CoaBC [Bernardetiaceae bacterium]MDW8205627.1 bifunctional phosphopantothenoylcysteine decarboxylase/phosphopantothenate--cysteine ligase CoaBC [Cytophagales bacterium]
MLKGKKILIGVCGSIAAYKTATLIRLLVKQQAEVQVIITDAAADFISPLTLATLSKKPVLKHYTANSETGEWNNHVALGLWADLMLIAPATAHTLAKMASGLCDNLLMAAYLSARCPVAVAPAMDLDMWHHPATQRNISRLQADGCYVIPPGEGELASGLSGKGRMAEPEQIAQWLSLFFTASNWLKGKNVLLTAGPTIEPIDPVRYITNHSTGKMGYALAQAFADAGASVRLISGPVSLQLLHPLVQITPVHTARQMHQAVMERLSQADIIVHCAAVADYAPAQIAPQKIKKQEERLTLDLVKNPDIAAEAGQRLQWHQVHAGFALETDHEEANAHQKMLRKNFDLIVLNSLNQKGAGFGHDTNRVTLLFRDGKREDLPLLPKNEVARIIVQHLTQLLQTKSHVV